MEPEILKVARAVIAGVTAEDREAARWFEGAAEREERHAAAHRESLAYCPPDDPGYVTLGRFAAAADAYAARYRRAAEALLRPDEAAKLRGLLAKAREVLADVALGVPVQMARASGLVDRIDAATKGGGK